MPHSSKSPAVAATRPKLRYLARTDSIDRLYLSSSISYLLRGFLSAEMGPLGAVGRGVEREIEV